LADALGDTRRAFDVAAADYDRSNADNALLCAMRRRVLAVILRHARPGGRLLDLGCGPGTDEQDFARAGYLVTAVDWSPAMVEKARRRVRHAGLDGRVDVYHLGIHELQRLPAGRFDVACSNFGPLNCVPDLAGAARLIAARLKPGGVLVASVIGRVCPWEIALYLARGNLARARVRFSSVPVPVPLGGETVWTRYYTPRELERLFEPAGFSRVLLRTLGLFVPPPYMDGFAARHRRMVGALQRLEDWTGEWPVLRTCGDHFLIALRKV
jgi:SAM-dependent methyltransferase